MRCGHSYISGFYDGFRFAEKILQKNPNPEKLLMWCRKQQKERPEDVAKKKTLWRALFDRFQLGLEVWRLERKSG